MQNTLNMSSVAPDRRTINYERIFALIGLFVLTLVVFATNLQSLNVPLAGEDLGFHRLSQWPSSRFYELFSPYTGFFYRPTVLVWFQFMGKLFGTSSLPYHVQGLALHALFAWLCGLLTWRLSRSPLATCLTAILFLLEPNWKTYGWPGTISTQFASCASLIAIHAWASYRHGRGWGLPVSLGATVFAFCSKQESFIIVPAIIALELLFFRSTARRFLLGFAPFLAISAAILPLQIIAQRTTALHPSWFLEGHGGDVISRYAGTTPSSHDIAVRFNNLPNLWSFLTNNVLPASNFATLFLILGACAAVLRFWPARDVKPLLWALLTFLVCSTPFQLMIGQAHWGDTRLQYLSIGFVCILAGLVIDGLLRHDRGVLAVALVALVSPRLTFTHDLFISWGLCAVACLMLALAAREKKVTWSTVGLCVLPSVLLVAPLLVDMPPWLLLPAAALGGFMLDRKRGALTCVLAIGAPWAILGMIVGSRESPTVKIGRERESERPYSMGVTSQA